MESYILNARLRNKPGELPDTEEIKQFINFIEKHIGIRNSMFYAKDTFNLGKEFECAVADLKAAFDLIFLMEEWLLMLNKPFQLLYVITFGEFEVPKRKNMFYGIVGDGVARAHWLMGRLRMSKANRFRVEIRDREESVYIESLFLLYQEIIDSWEAKDGRLIHGFLMDLNNNQLAEDFGRTRSGVWKKRRRLRIDHYWRIKNLIRQTPELIIKKKAAEKISAPPEAFLRR